VTESSTSNSQSSSSKHFAFLVAAGILLSRLAGLIRDRVFAHYFGNSDAADAFRAAFRIPNLLQNLFGEGVLSASFIPIYARLLASDDEAEARKTAGAIAALLMLTTTIIVLLGVLTSPLLIYVIAAGFKGETRGLTILLVEQNANRALEIAGYGYVLETGKITLQGDSQSLRANSQVRSAYLGG